jgi:hypothetical protein
MVLLTLKPDCLLAGAADPAFLLGTKLQSPAAALGNERRLAEVHSFLDIVTVIKKTKVSPMLPAPVHHFP